MTQLCKFVPENSDFELLIGGEGNMIRTRNEAGFEFLSKNAKTNFGVKNGKFMFEVKILEHVHTEEYYGPGHKAKQEFSNYTLQDQRHYITIGWTANPNLKTPGADQSSVSFDN